MTTATFTSWARSKMTSCRDWRVDPSHCEPEDLLIFCRMPNNPSVGVFVMVTKEAKEGYVLRTGRFLEAFPTIGDALFQPRRSYSGFDTCDDALVYAVENLGMTFLNHVSLPHSS